MGNPVSMSPGITMHVLMKALACLYVVPGAAIILGSLSDISANLTAAEMRSPQHLRGIEHSLLALTKSGKTGPAIQPFLTQIKELTTLMKVQIKTQSNASQISMDDSWKALNACSLGVEEASDLETWNHSHFLCRMTEHEEYMKLYTCEQELAILNQTVSARKDNFDLYDLSWPTDCSYPDAFPTPEVSSRPYMQELRDRFRDLFGVWDSAYGAWNESIAERNIKQEECNQLRGQRDQRKTICDNVQSHFESRACGESNPECAKYEECYSCAHDQWTAAKSSAEAAETTFLEEWRGILRIECLVDAFNSSIAAANATQTGSNLSDAIAGCRNADFSGDSFTSEIRLVYHPTTNETVPSKDHCGFVQNASMLPGSKHWTTTYYSNLPLTTPPALCHAACCVNEEDGCCFSIQFQYAALPCCLHTQFKDQTTCTALQGAAFGKTAGWASVCPASADEAWSHLAQDPPTPQGPIIVANRFTNVCPKSFFRILTEAECKQAAETWKDAVRYKGAKGFVNAPVGCLLEREYGDIWFNTNFTNYNHTGILYASEDFTQFGAGGVLPLSVCQATDAGDKLVLSTVMHLGEYSAWEERNGLDGNCTGCSDEWPKYLDLETQSGVDTLNSYMRGRNINCRIHNLTGVTRVTVGDKRGSALSVTADGQSLRAETEAVALGTSYVTIEKSACEACIVGITYRSNRACSAVSTCIQGSTYQTVAPTLFSDRVCSVVSNCSLGFTYETSVPTLTEDRVCGSVTSCQLGSTYEAAAPTLTSNRVCSAVITCIEGRSYETTAATLTSDRVCTNVTTCSLGETYETSAPTIAADRVCSNVSAECVLGESYESEAPTLEADRVCTNVSRCIQGETYESQAPTGTTDRVCTSLSSICVMGETYESVSPTTSRDRVCTAVTTCALGSTYETSVPTITTDRVCSNATLCTHGETYQTLAPTLTSDRVCSNVTTCTQGQTFETRAPTLLANRVCSNVSTCNQGQTYESSAPTPVADRVCNNVSQCAFNSTYQTQSPTLTSDRVCTAVSTCRFLQPEVAAPTLTSDRICQAYIVGTYGTNECPDGYAKVESLGSCQDIATLQQKPYHGKLSLFLQLFYPGGCIQLHDPNTGQDTLSYNPRSGKTFHDAAPICKKVYA
eukprot:TRINITY_DN7578_c0_g1_i2.p1 TRINITY_DN7578_c0_g1~~TRINITY_DN7578_c0_g1_i2.p1  ORF type:complete len:1135 (+),score=118.28 TRINITY_DN7578_c0_g1_i2:60-3464(+)